MARYRENVKFKKAIQQVEDSKKILSYRNGYTPSVVHKETLMVESTQYWKKYFNKKEKKSVQNYRYMY